MWGGDGGRLSGGGGVWGGGCGGEGGGGGLYKNQGICLGGSEGG